MSEKTIKTKDQQNLNEGHRQRLLEKLANEGEEKLEDHEYLEILLFYALPRKNTNLIAHNLIKRFGSFDRVLDAPELSIREIDGMGERSTQFLQLFRGAMRRYAKNKILNQNQDNQMDNIQKVMDYFKAELSFKTDEAIYVLLLDNKLSKIRCDNFNKGSLSSVSIYPRKLIEYVLHYKAAAVIIAHNHPNGSLDPSTDDISTTYTIKDLLSLIDVPLLEHILIANGEAIPIMSSYNINSNNLTSNNSESKIEAKLLDKWNQNNEQFEYNKNHYSTGIPLQTNTFNSLL